MQQSPIRSSSSIQYDSLSIFFRHLNLTSFLYAPASLMNIIDGPRAIMLFPRSTMSHRTSFTTRRASADENIDMDSQKIRLDRYSMLSRLAAVDGRPGSLRAELREIGRRSYGDRECWVIPHCLLGSIDSTQELNTHLTNNVRAVGIFPLCLRERIPCIRRPLAVGSWRSVSYHLWTIGDSECCILYWNSATNFPGPGFVQDSRDSSLYFPHKG